MSKCVLVTGGAGYIGSHSCIELMHTGYEIVVVDNFCNSNPVSVQRLQQLAGQACIFYQADIRDKAALADIFERHSIDAVIHFAGLKAVGESAQKPLLYYDNNVAGTLNLCQVMAEARVKRIVFSSSATVYGDPYTVPIREDFPVGATTNPYGRSKFMVEEILRDLLASDSAWQVVLLRYFNPVGAHESGLIGEDPNGIPNNLMPYITQVALGRREYLNVWSNDYPTHDGTGVRDYIHVVDLAKGHVAALEYMNRTGKNLTVNLGTGRGYSVLDVVHAFENVNRCKVPYQIGPRRPGDIAACYADPSLAKELLGWSAQKGLEEMCADAWRWQQQNPCGYDS